ncbi:MAG: hypothetical protein ACFFBP_11545 [Promethearchaeota archaeon]
MKLYKISEEGTLNEVNKLDFIEDDVYIVDDDKTIYIWVGLKVPQSLKDTTASTARQLDKERGGASKILIMKQNREYGSFLAIMSQLKKGLKAGIDVERRPELELEPPDVIKWLNQLKKYRKIAPELKYAVFREGYPVIEEEEVQEELNFEEQVRVAAYYLSKEDYTYDELCWMLAERIMKQMTRLASIEDIRLKAEEVFRSSSTYDELCWLIGELDILNKFNFFEDEITPTL